MSRSSKIYAKEKQIELIDNILFSLCVRELSSDGRKYLKKMKQKISIEIVQLKYLDSKQLKKTTLPQNGKKFIFQNTYKAV